ncbi:MAG: glycosyltransferase [Cyclobacteriaceae bacterium]|nr:glycosyltransferase [Cyclobacteriaceae bacterium]
MQKRVAFIVGTLQTGGIERTVTDWCLYLKANTTWEPMIICLLKRNGPFLDILEKNGIIVKECKVHQRGFTIRLKRLLQELNPDVVHSQVAFSMPWQVLGILWSGSRRIIFTQQNEYQNWNPLMARLRLRLYFLIFFPFIDQYTCVSERVKDSLSALSGKSPHQFLVIPNSVNTDIFFPDPEKREQQRLQLKVEPSTFLAGMVARFSIQKGHQYLIEAIRMLKEKKVEGKFLLVGVGDLENEIHALVKQYGLSEDVLFYGQATAVNHLLQALDCFILSSLWEGMPLALLEAMASGVPVIATDVAGTREVLKHQENGILIPSRSPESIVEAFVQLKESPELRKKLSQQALTFIREKYSVEANMKVYISLYES